MHDFNIYVIFLIRKDTSTFRNTHKIDMKNTVNIFVVVGVHHYQYIKKLLHE